MSISPSFMFVFRYLGYSVSSWLCFPSFALCAADLSYHLTTTSTATTVANAKLHAVACRPSWLVAATPSSPIVAVSRLSSLHARCSTVVVARCSPLLVISLRVSSSFVAPVVARHRSSSFAVAGRHLSLIVHRRSSLAVVACRHRSSLRPRFSALVVARRHS